VVDLSDKMLDCDKLSFCSSIELELDLEEDVEFAIEPRKLETLVDPRV
jgi:hypothetical protein